MINPNHDLFRWGPIPGKPIYVSFFMDSIAHGFPNIYQYRWPEIEFYFIEDKMTFICDYPNLRKSGEKNFNVWVMDDQKFEKTKKNYAKAVKQLLTQNERVKNLHKLTDLQLLKLYQDWQEAYLNFWDHGLVPEIANWGAEKLLKDKLSAIVKDQADFIRALEKLSAPTQLSFYIEEESDLLKLKGKEKSKEFYELLQKHAQKYFWINNSYFETKVLDEKYFEGRLKEVLVKEAQAKIKTIIAHSQKTKEEKEVIIKEFKLSKDIQKIAERLSYCVYWQDARKGKIFLANHYIHEFLVEISRRKNIVISDLEKYWNREIEELLQGKPLSEKVVEQRRKMSAGYYTDDLKVITGREAEDIIQPFLEKKVDKNITVLKGTVASMGKGIVRGKVRILLHPNEWQKMQKGEILIAPMTSPEYILAMRKAAAIVTDEGGMTSHAAIVSRELGIPCIVGTNLATKVFKDGDEIEVDVKKGGVRKIK